MVSPPRTADFEHLIASLAAEASRRGIDLFHPATGIRVDFIFTSIPYERQALTRSVKVRLAGVDVPFVSVDDLILYKLFAGRPRDIEDVVGIIRRKNADIDWPYIERWAEEFAEVEGRKHLIHQVHNLRRTGQP